MNDKLFKTRFSKWNSEGKLTAFNLACVAEGLDTVKGLKEQNIGEEIKAFYINLAKKHFSQLSLSIKTQHIHRMCALCLFSD